MQTFVLTLAWKTVTAETHHCLLPWQRKEDRWILWFTPWMELSKFPSLDTIKVHPLTSMQIFSCSSLTWRVYRLELFPNVSISLPCSFFPNPNQISSQGEDKKMKMVSGVENLPRTHWHGFKFPLLKRPVNWNLEMFTLQMHLIFLPL